MDVVLRWIARHNQVLQYAHQIGNKLGNKTQQRVATRIKRHASKTHTSLYIATHKLVRSSAWGQRDCWKYSQETIVALLLATGRVPRKWTSGFAENHQGFIRVGGYPLKDEDTHNHTLNHYMYMCTCNYHETQKYQGNGQRYIGGCVFFENVQRSFKINSIERWPINFYAH